MILDEAEDVRIMVQANRKVRATGDKREHTYKAASRF